MDVQGCFGTKRVYVTVSGGSGGNPAALLAGSLYDRDNGSGLLLT